MKKKFLVLAIVIALTAVVFVGCNGNQDNENAPIRVATLSGPSGMGMAYLFDNEDLDVKVFTAPDQINAKIINGEIDIASVPANLAAVLYNKTNKGVKILSMNTYGMLYVVGEKSNNISSITDLEGRTLYATGKGATPEYALAEIIARKGVDIEVEYLAEHSQLASDLIEGTKTLGVLPEPFVSMTLAGNSNLEIKIDLNEEWKDIYGQDSALPMTATIVRTEYLAKNSDKIASFKQAYQESVTKVNADPAAAAQLIVDNGIFPQKAVAQNAIPRCNICYIDGEEAKSVLQNYFSVLHEANATAVGGALPGEDIYA